MKAPSPLLGFNNNFKHKGAVYHIQTEDSGVKHPHIITHLFADGGRILKSIKTSYSAYLSEPNMAEIVRSMMKEQHKAMIVALRDGRFDPGGSREVDLPADGYFANVTNPGAPKKTGENPVVPPAPKAPSFDVGVEKLERASASVRAATPADDLPPPPANVLGGGAARPHGEYASVQPGRKSVRPPSMRPGSARPAPGSVRPPGGSVRPPPAAHHSDSRQLNAPSTRPGSGRYAMTRPASIFATSKPSTKGSIFGEELISERSLDEVILAYLAEDLEGDKK
jgi:hypothetical protein